MRSETHHRPIAAIQAHRAEILTAAYAANPNRRDDAGSW
jgi:hypothetical protein